MTNPTFIVQASSVNWSGSHDICMSEVRGHPAVYHTISLLQKSFPSSFIIVAAPEFDSGGSLKDSLQQLAAMSPNQIKFHFSHDKSPLLRMLEALNQHSPDCEAIIRIDGLNMFFQPLHLKELWDLGSKKNLACATFPADYPAQFTADYYEVAALKKISMKLAQDDPHHVHIKYGLQDDSNSSTGELTPSDILSKNTLLAAREDAKYIYHMPRDEMVNGTQSFNHGDTLLFHYKLSLQFIESHHKVLDIACGGMKGPALLATKASHVIGADLDAGMINQNISRTPKNLPLSFSCEDVTATSFENESFDVITSFETIEHVDENMYLVELDRLLMPGGLLFLSTPQNSHGHIPINPQHKIEYSLEELINLVTEFFNIEEVIGIKQGCIIKQNDPVGSNTFMRLTKKG